MVLTLSALGVSAPAAQAAPPNNDTFPDATLVTIGFSEVLSTTEATTDASVWNVLKGNGTGVVVDVSQSHYSAGVLVGVGTQGNLTTVACAPGAVGFFAEAGTTYYILAIDDQLDGGGNGGNLSIVFGEIPPPPTVEITVNPYGTFNSRTGTSTISGTYTCTNGDFIQVDVEARQRVGRLVILGTGGFFDAGTCDGTPHSWSAEIFPQNGIFECGFNYVEQQVQLCGK